MQSVLPLRLRVPIIFEALLSVDPLLPPDLPPLIPEIEQRFDIRSNKSIEYWSAMKDPGKQMFLGPLLY